LYGSAATEHVAAWHRSFPHNYNQVSRELMYNWMNKYLKLGQVEPVVEKPFEPVLPAELSVYDEKHPVSPRFDRCRRASQGNDSELGCASSPHWPRIPRNIVA